MPPISQPILIIKHGSVKISLPSGTGSAARISLVNDARKSTLFDTRIYAVLHSSPVVCGNDCPGRSSGSFFVTKVRHIPVTLQRSIRQYSTWTSNYGIFNNLARGERFDPPVDHFTLRPLPVCVFRRVKGELHASPAAAAMGSAAGFAFVKCRPPFVN